VEEFVRLVAIAAKHVQNHPQFKELVKDVDDDLINDRKHDEL
jgi:hypothetical protein